MEKWEYKSLLVEDGKLDLTLNALGDDGWELASLTTAHVTDEGRYGQNVPGLVVGRVVPPYLAVVKRRKEK